MNASEQHLQASRQAFERMITMLATQFINQPPEELPEALEHALGEMCRYAGTDRGYLLRFSPELDEFSCVVEWAPEGQERHRDVIQHLPTESLEWWVRKMQSGAIHVLTSTGGQPLESTEAGSILSHTGIEAVVEVPIFTQGRLAAVVGLASESEVRTWAEKDLNLFTITAHVIANALERLEREEALRERERQLLQAQRMESVGRLAGGIAHDFNNLLFSISSTAELILLDAVAGSDLAADAKEILGAAERASSLTRQLLAFARQQDLHPEIIRLNDSVREVLSLLPRVLSEDIRVVRKLDSALPPVAGDRHLIEQLVMNLAANARDAMPQGGTFTLETRTTVLRADAPPPVEGMAAGRYVLLLVSDDGEGMSEEVRAQAFEPFYTTRPAGLGTGLGLAAALGIVEQHDGFIAVDSAPGMGTRFSIYFPVAGERRISSGSLPAEASTGEGETVLLVEDAPLPRQAVRRILERSGYRVLEAGSGREALRLCASHNGIIHVLLTDIVMPEMNGRALKERIAELRPRVKVIYMSGYSPETIPGATDAEPDLLFLQKPVTMPVLLDALRRALKSRGATP